MKKINTEIFIKNANIVHNFTYDYSLSKYLLSKEKIKIICPIHGMFEQTPDSHLCGRGCPRCGMELTRVKQLKSEDDFIVAAKITHKNKYDYSKIKYCGSHKKIKIICPIHGMFEQTPDSHLRGSGCPRCVNRNKTTNIFIDESNLVHQFKYDYSQCEYINPCIKVKIICLKHGMFEQIPGSHLHGRGCPICCSSKGEILILKYLNKNKINFIREKRFSDCKNKYRLPFDFYLPEYGVLIEYDGIQHVQSTNFFGVSDEIATQNFNKLKINDSIKNVYAKNNGFELIRVSHDIENVDDYLKNNLSTIITKTI